MLLLTSADFFQHLLFRKILSGIPSECETVWIQYRTDRKSVLIWVQTGCIGYQQTTKFSARIVKPLCTVDDMQQETKMTSFTEECGGLVVECLTQDCVT